jgi:hypothetical protein
MNDPAFSPAAPRANKHAAMLNQKYALCFAPASAWHAHNFQFSQDALDACRILDSFNSTPARYVEEMASRIMQTSPGADGALLLFNPYLSLDGHEIRTVLGHADRLRTDSRRAAVFSARNGLPLAFYLPCGICDTSRYLLLLSCVNAAADAKLLQAAYFAPCDDIRLPLDGRISLTRLNGFLGGAHMEPMVWCAEAGAAAINAATVNATPPLCELSEMRAARDRLGLYAFFPFHAGDILFMAMASRRGESLFDGVVIHRDYSDIARRADFKLKILEIDGPVPARGGYNKGDTEYFLDTAPTLPAANLYVYCRATRDYNITNFHLIDHIGFALGKRYASGADLYHRPDARAHIGGTGLGITRRPPRIFMHLDAGWSLKIYPAALQRDLVRALLERGYEITILDGKEAIAGCRRITFQGIDALEREMSSHDLVVGMDSFPAHFASLLLKIPTICLFSCTHPVNFSSSMSPDYLWLSNNFDCAPCQQTQHCYRFGGTECRNFSAPGRVAQVIDSMLGPRQAARAPSKNAEDLPQVAFSHLPSARVPRFLHADQPTPILLRDGFSPSLLSAAAYAIRKSAFYSLASLASSLAYEYFYLAGHGGFLRANNRAFAYFRRLKRRKHLAAMKRGNSVANSG